MPRPALHGPAQGPALVPQRAPQSQSPLALWHLLSLDAPTVAALWTVFIARCADITLPWTAPVAMFLAVWMLYAADRLLDARPHANGTTPADLEERHRFHHRHRRGFLAAIAGAAVVLALTLHRLDPTALHLYAALGVLLAAWLLLIHARTQADTEPHRLPKELAVGVFFPAAVFIPTVARVPELRVALLPAAALLAAVCTLNCLFLYAWEHPGPRLHAHWTTRWATRYLPLLAMGVVVASLLASVLEIDRHLFPVAALTLPALSLAAFACALSAAMLLLLHNRRRAVQAVTLRAAADLVLLTPLLLLPLLLHFRVR
jgi:hypothetical protein